MLKSRKIDSSTFQSLFSDVYAVSGVCGVVCVCVLARSCSYLSKYLPFHRNSEKSNHMLSATSNTDRKFSQTLCNSCIRRVTLLRGLYACRPNHVEKLALNTSPHQLCRPLGVQSGDLELV